jgi:hypothetical protein
MKGKNIILPLAAILAFVLLYGYTKAKKLIGVFDKITIEPDKISFPDLSWTRIKFNIDIMLTNPTQESFDVSGYGVAKLKKIHLFWKGTYIATSTVNLVEISIPSNNQLTIHDIPVEIPTKFILQNVKLIQSMFDDFDVKYLTTTGILEVAGNDIEIGS